MGKEYDQAELAREYNVACGRIFREERMGRGLSLEKMASGLLSKTALGRMESGEAGWRKLTGDILFQRMGILPDYFEMVASSDELARWRLREDICLLFPGSLREAGGKIRQYRERYPKREPVEEQFLCKAELLLLLKDRGEILEGERLMSMAEAAISCTVPGGWRGRADTFLLSPPELEAVLLLGAVQMVCGRMEEAWQMQNAVWNYSGEHKWKSRLAVRIKPQAALLGIELALREEDTRKAFEFGREALEMLRCNACHCYLLPLLEQIGRISGEGMGEEVQAYLRETNVFLNIFRRIYDITEYPGSRIWQGISVENTRDAGIVLKMLRKFAGKPREKAIYDDEGIIMTRRQLEKIERGDHMPSYANYQRLVRQYGKCGGWMVPMLETKSVEVLELRQEISSLIGFCQWDKVEVGMERLRRKVNMAYPRVRQEFLFFEAIILLKRKGDLEKSLELLQEALHVTMPDREGTEAKWWVFQREETIIASNIMDICRKLGRIEEARNWWEILQFSTEKQRSRSGIAHTGYAILMESYDNYLGETKRFGDAIKASEEAVSHYIEQPLIDALDRAFYRIAWNIYEMASGQRAKIFRMQWKEAFQMSETVASFTYDNFMIEFLKDRRDKYLQ